MNTKTYEYFVLDLVKLLKEQIETVFKEQNSQLSSEDKILMSGQIISLYSVTKSNKILSHCFWNSFERIGAGKL